MPRLVTCVLFLAALLAPARAQVAPTVTRPLVLSAYGTASVSGHELGFGHALGYSGGLILDHSRWLALDFRGVILRERVPLHTYVAEAGPRVSRKLGPLHLYVEVLGGLGHTGYLVTRHELTSGYGWLGTGDAGLDLKVTPHFQWRVADYSYSRIYAANTVKISILSTGLLYRF